MFFKVDKITNITEIKYVSRLLRSELRKVELPDAFSHNDSIIRNIAKIISKQMKQLCRLAVKMIVGNISWKLVMNQNPPKFLTYIVDETNWGTYKRFWHQNSITYIKVNKIITKMKSSGSSCPIDQVTTVMLKKCPILRTIVWKVCFIAGKITTSQLNGKMVRQSLFIRRVIQTIYQTLDLLH